MASWLRRSRSPGVWLVATFVLLGLAWIISSPPGAGVDETSHYIRVVGLAHGQLLGDPVDPDRPLGDLAGEQLRRVNAEAGMYRIPGAGPPPSACNVFDPAMPYLCPQYPQQEMARNEVSLHARYLPGAYVVPAAFARFGSTMWQTLALARLGVLLQNAALLLVVVRAFGVLHRCGWRFTTGSAALAALSFTPLLAFLSGTLSPSSTEAWAVAAFVASLVALARTGSSRWLWLAVVTAVMACWVRDLGAAAVVLSAVLVGVLEPGLRRWWRTARRDRWWATGAVLVAVVAAMLWQAALKQPVAPTSLSLGDLWRELRQVPGTLRDAVGLLGWLNVPLDPLVETAWILAWAAAFGVVVVSGSRRLRLVLVVQGVVVVVAAVVLSLSMRAAGFGMQARFLLPLLAMLVLLAVTSPSGDRPMSPWIVRVVLAVCALGHGSGLLISAHRNANGLTGGSIDFGAAAWFPPGGWLPAVALGATACLVLACTPLRSGAESSAAEPGEAGR